ncbi:MAG: hypothetical protein ACM3OO_02525, partial [Planctomycetaceae bacterium]
MGAVRPDPRRLAPLTDASAARRASVAGAVAAGVLTVAIYAGSDLLRTFDAALIGYATATILLTFGAV